jgi:hypothetical protein
MNREGSPKVCSGVIPEIKRDNIAVLKKAISGGAYKVKAEDIAEKILKERLFDVALTLYSHKYQKCRNNQSLTWPGNPANSLSLTSEKNEEQLAEMKFFSAFSAGTWDDANGRR